MRIKPIPFFISAAACALAYWLGRQHTSVRTDKGDRLAKDSAPATILSRNRHTKTGEGPGSTHQTKSYASVLGPPSAEEEAKPAVERVRDALAEPNEFRRLQLFWRALTDMKPDDTRGIQDLFDEGDRLGRHYPAEYRYFAQRWGEIDGAAALAHGIQAWENRGGMDGMLSGMAEGWATEDPEAAADWMNKQESLKPWMENAVMEGLVRGLGHTNPARARQFVEQLADDPRAAHYFCQLADITIYTQGLTEAEQWFHSINAPTLEAPREALLDHLTDRYLRGGPEQAAQFLSRQADRWSTRPDLAERVAMQWIRTDPVKTQAWIATLPGGVRETLENQLVPR